MQAFDVMARKENGGWETIKEVKGNKEERVSLKLSHGVITDGIKIRVKRTSNDASERRKNVRRIDNWIIFSGSIRSSGKIKEIELYGYVDTSHPKSQKLNKVDQKEINELLNE